MIEWNQFTNNGAGTPVITFIFIASGLFFFIILLCILGLLIKSFRNKNRQRVASERIYEVVPDSSFSCYVDSALPMKMFLQRNYENPCCICFDRQFLFRIILKSYIRRSSLMFKITFFIKNK